MQRPPEAAQALPGWGIDNDPNNDPTYPIKPARTDAEQTGYSWERPPLQPTNGVEILHSNERPNLTAVFGTAVPPKGLSGVLRRFAFRYSENEFTHWLGLLLADRVNVVEGIVEDLAQGHVPNLWAEKGYDAEWKHNKKGLITKLAVGAALATGVALWLSAGKSGKKKRRRQAARAAAEAWQYDLFDPTDDELTRASRH